MNAIRQTMRPPTAPVRIPAAITIAGLEADIDAGEPGAIARQRKDEAIRHIDEPETRPGHEMPIASVP